MRKLMTPQIIIRVAGVCGLMTTLWGAPALGQHYVGNGQAIDANLQQGSGGVNQPQQVPDYGARNDLVTGNVPGLGYFRGDVGYTSASEFRGGLGGADDLFRFRAQSLSPAPGGAYTTGQLNPQVGVYRDFYGTVPSATSGSGANTYGVGAGDGDAAPYRYAGVNVQTHQPGGFGQSRDEFTPSAISPSDYQQRVAVVTSPEGDVLEVNASPLLGLRRRNLGQQQEEAAAEMTQPQADSRVPVQMAEPRSLTPVAPPSVELGRQMLGMVDRMQMGQQAITDQNRLAAIEAGIFNALDSTGGAEGRNAYVDMLSQIKTAQPPATPGQAQEDPSEDSGDGLPSDPTAKQAQGQTERPQPGTRRLGTLGRLLDTLDYDLPRVQSLAGDNDSYVNRLIQQAQGEVQTGKYLDAQDHFQQAVRLGPDNPMGRVGLIHAQLGAGMIRSAELSMRALFERHPELIAARYDPKLLPSSNRLEWVRDGLMKAAEMGSGYESALMLAYIGYQADEDGLTQYGLDLASERVANDPLVELLREIWLEKPSAEQEAQPEQENQAAEDRAEPMEDMEEPDDNGNDAPAPQTPASETQAVEELAPPQK